MLIINIVLALVAALLLLELLEKRTGLDSRTSRSPSWP